MPTAVLNNPVYPSLQAVMDLFRGLVNAGGGTANPQGVAQNSASFVLPFLNSAIQDTFSDLRVVGAPRLIRDGYILTGIPALTAPNPSIQPYLSYTGYFDGSQMHPNLFLPSDLLEPEQVRQRQSGTSTPFLQVVPRGTLKSGYQSYGFGSWEWRNDNLYFNGSLISMDLWIRYIAGYPPILGTNLDFTQTYVPIRGSLNTITYKMVANYAFRLKPEQYAMAKQEAEEKTTKLQQEITLAQQGQV